MSFVENLDFIENKCEEKHLFCGDIIEVIQDIDGGMFPFCISFPGSVYFTSLQKAIELRDKLDFEIAAFNVAKSEVASPERRDD